MARPLFDYSHLSTDERIELAEELWDSLAEAPDAVPLTAEQAEELDRRLESYQKDQNPGVPWVEALRKIEEPGE